MGKPAGATAHEFIFGDKFERSLQHIVGQAYEANTREAYQAAVHKLHGINTLLLFMSSEGGPAMPTAHLMVRNLMSQVREVAESPSGRLSKQAHA